MKICGFTAQIGAQRNNRINVACCEMWPLQSKAFDQIQFMCLIESRPRPISGALVNSCEKLQLSSSMSLRLSVRPLAWKSATSTGRILVKFNSGIFAMICHYIPILVKIRTPDGQFTWRLAYIFISPFMSYTRNWAAMCPLSCQSWGRKAKHNKRFTFYLHIDY